MQSLKNRAKRIGINCVGYQFRKTARVLNRIFDKSFEKEGITSHQFSMMCALAALEKMSVKELTLEIMAERTTLVRNLQIAEKEGFVKTISGSNSRKELWTLTEKGKRKLENCFEIWEEVNERIFQVIDRSKWKSARKQLTSIQNKFFEEV